MATYTVRCLTRDEQGRYDCFFARIPAVDVDEAVSWLLHRFQHDNRPVESDIVVENPITGEHHRTGVRP